MHITFRRRLLQLLILAVISSTVFTSAAQSRLNQQRSSSNNACAYLTQAQAAASKPAYDAAVQNFITSLQASVPTARWGQAFTLGQYSVRFTPATPNGDVWDPAYFDSFIPASSVRIRNLRKRLVVNGSGVALVGLKQLSDYQLRSTPFLPQESGVSVAVTAVIGFQQGAGGGPVEAVVTLYNPKLSSVALAADYSAPVEVLVEKSPSDDFVRKALKNPSAYKNITGLFMMEPYSPNRIPVILVHGLDSSVRTWQDTYNELMADPNVRQRYQFWFFRYPTGSPVAVSAANFRDSLRSLRSYYDPSSNNPYFNQTVVVGHSMGGLLTRMLVTNPGNALWSAHSNVPFDQANLNASDRAQLGRALFFRPESCIKRVVFIATPHRGSTLAEGDMAGLAKKLIKAPASLVDGSNDGTWDLSDMIPSSIDNLTPSNTFIRTLQNLPILVPHHSILGNQGVVFRGVPGSDSVVPYWSSHLDSAESEVVINSDHSVHQHPKGIEELRRILTQHLQ